MPPDGCGHVFTLGHCGSFRTLDRERTTTSYNLRHTPQLIAVVEAIIPTSSPPETSVWYPQGLDSKLRRSPTHGLLFVVIWGICCLRIRPIQECLPLPSNSLSLLTKRQRSLFKVWLFVTFAAELQQVQPKS